MSPVSWNMDEQSPFNELVPSRLHCQFQLRNTIMIHGPLNEIFIPTFANLFYFDPQFEIDPKIWKSL